MPDAKGVEGGPRRVMCLEGKREVSGWRWMGEEGRQRGYQMWMSEVGPRAIVVPGGGVVVRSASS